VWNWLVKMKIAFRVIWFSLKSETINNFSILLAAILETVASKKWPWMQFSSLPINSSLQNNLRYRVIFFFKMAANKIDKISMFSNFNENWYLRLFWSEELIGNDFHWNRRPLTIWRFCWQPFWKWWPRKNEPECKFHHYQPIPHFKIILDINFHWNRRPFTI
jgi:hypothetical protein